MSYTILRNPPNPHKCELPSIQVGDQDQHQGTVARCDECGLIYKFSDVGDGWHRWRAFLLQGRARRRYQEADR